MTDDEIADLIGDFVIAAGRAHDAGFDFVDVKHCHGYLGHEFLSAIDRQGRYGGSFENRTRFLREIVAGIRGDLPDLEIGVRLSAFDWIPFNPDADGIGTPASWSNEHYPYAFGGDGDGTSIDLTEPNAFLDLLAIARHPDGLHHRRQPLLHAAHPATGAVPALGRLSAAGRPAGRRRPADRGDRPAQSRASRPDDRRLRLLVSARLAAQRGAERGRAPAKPISSAWGGWCWRIRSCPPMCSTGKPLERKRICRTFSDCTTAPRNGMVSGCYPLDDFYKQRDEAKALAALKKGE